jgi:DNA-binding transcriptional LysR family regulator
MVSLRRLIHSPGALLAFEAAARLGSFTRAAEELSVTQAAISYSMRHLEQALNVQLFARGHRRVSLTASGRRFYQDVSIGLAHIRRSAEALRFEAEARHVTLSISTAFANYWMVPRLAEFRDRNPEIDIRLQTTDKDVDLMAEGIPLGIRRGHGDWEEYDSSFLTEEIIYPVASPRYLREHREPTRPADLVKHYLIHLEEPVRPRPTWTDWFRANGVAAPVPEDGLRLND